jgi:REP-associated tyrosine transposase
VAKIGTRPQIKTAWGPVPAPRRTRVKRAAASATAPPPTQSAARRARAKKRLAQRAPGQLSLGEVVTRGGRRAGAGRKRGLRPNVPHRPREVHRDYQPVHVTLRRAKGLPSLRSQRLERVVRDAMRATTRARDGAFRVTDYSIQNDHVHLIVEADEHRERVGLSRAMRSFVIRLALRLNKELGRNRGKVWGDRFHARELTSPSEVRKALVYLLGNQIKHGEWEVGIVDPFSSGPWFGGWMQVLERPPDPSPVERPRTWLLDWGWHRGRDFIHLGEMPRAVRAA